MADRGGFSIASVILSYFLVAGGIALGLIAVILAEPGGQAALYGALAAGGAIGGFVAARASRGTTVLEPAIGGVLVILTMVGIFVGTELGQILWAFAEDEVTKYVGLSAAAAAVGAIVGAIVSEKLFGRHSESSLAWLVHVSIAVLGACFVATVVLMGAVIRGEQESSTQAGVYFGAMGLGALLSGLAAGASAPRRLLVVSFIASIAGVMGFYLLFRELPGVNGGTTANAKDTDTAAGFAIIGVGCGIVTLIGALIGWKAIGQRHARR